MAAERLPGPLGEEGGGRLVSPGYGGATFTFRRDSTKAGGRPGPIGRHYVYADKDGSSGQSSAAKAKALIIIGAGQEDLKNGRSDKQLEDALRAAFSQYVDGRDVKVGFVKNANEMTRLIKSGAWDVVIYFGHGVINAQDLSPGHAQGKNAFLSRNDLASALATAQAKKVYLLGCMSAATGLARGLSKDLPGTKVYGTRDLMDATWNSGHNSQGSFNNFTLSEQPLEYTNNVRTQNGNPTLQRPFEFGDKVTIDPNAAIGTEPMVDQ